MKLIQLQDFVKYSDEDIKTRVIDSGISSKIRDIYNKRIKYSDDTIHCIILRYLGIPPRPVYYQGKLNKKKAYQPYNIVAAIKGNRLDNNSFLIGFYRLKFGGISLVLEIIFELDGNTNTAKNIEIYRDDWSPTQEDIQHVY